MCVCVCVWDSWELVCNRWFCVVCVCGTVVGVSVQQVVLCCVCVWDSWGSECAAGGFVLCVCVWDSWGSECAAGGFVLCVCVCVGQLGE